MTFNDYIFHGLWSGISTCIKSKTPRHLDCDDMSQSATEKDYF